MKNVNGLPSGNDTPGNPAGEAGRLVAVARYRLLTEGGQARGNAQLDELGVEVGGGGNDHPVDPGR
jgi:hypothetical protein